MRTVPAGNCARFATTPLSGGGTPSKAWRAALDNAPLPTLDLGCCPGLVVIAPHPDDETLGLGATVAQLVAAGVDVQVVAVSDGGAARPGATRLERDRLEPRRRHELRSAREVLGIRRVDSLGLPDGDLAVHEDRLADRLEDILSGVVSGIWCAATWRGDGHPDHEAVGRAAATACERTGITLLEYPVWMWHWARPGDPAVPWERACSVAEAPWAQRRKHTAAQCFRSQFEPGAEGLAPVLPPFVLQRLLTVGELVFR